VILGENNSADWGKNVVTAFPGGNSERQKNKTKALCLLKKGGGLFAQGKRKGALSALPKRIYLVSSQKKTSCFLEGGDVMKGGDVETSILGGGVGFVEKRKTYGIKIDTGGSHETTTRNRQRGNNTLEEDGKKSPSI